VWLDILAGKKSPNGSQKSPKKFVNCYIFKNLCKKKPKISYFVIIKIPRETITLSAKIHQIWSPWLKDKSIEALTPNQCDKNVKKGSKPMKKWNRNFCKMKTALNRAKINVDNKPVRWARREEEETKYFEWEKCGKKEIRKKIRRMLSTARTCQTWGKSAGWEGWGRRGGERKWISFEWMTGSITFETSTLKTFCSDFYSISFTNKSDCLPVERYLLAIHLKK
jgi:hypothetical protein